MQAGLPPVAIDFFGLFIVHFIVYSVHDLL